MILKDAREYAATVCQSDETHFLVNGSSCGVLSAIYSATKQGGELIMSRNSHKAVYHAVELRQLKAHYLYPEMLEEGILGSITVDMVEEAFDKYPDAKTLVITSPTYDGVVSDIKSIVKIAHSRGVTVIVDEAHGGHFLKESGFPNSAIRCGADVVIQSIRKMLPAMKQTGLIHINQDYKYKENLRKYLEMFQTPNPSEILLESIDGAMHWYVEEGRDCYKEYLGNIKKLRTALQEQLKYLKVILPENVFDYDLSKTILSTKNSNISGEDLQKILSNQYGISSDIVSLDCVLILTSASDKNEDYRRILDAVLKIDEGLEKQLIQDKPDNEITRPKAYMLISEAVEKEKKAVPLPESMGEASAVYVYLYPMGIPLLTPGEKISERCVRSLQYYLEEGWEIHGLTEEREIEIVWEEYFI